MHKFNSDKSLERYKKKKKTLDHIENNCKPWEAKSPNSALVSDLPFIQTVISLASHAIELEDCAIWRGGGGEGF